MRELALFSAGVSQPCPVQVPTPSAQVMLSTLERPLRGCGVLEAFPCCLDESCLQGIGAEMILFSMLLSILLRITPSVQASECKWLHQFFKYKLKKEKNKNACG